nr:signal peptide peptidase-like 2B isoform X2 [Camelus dromedarius]
MVCACMMGKELQEGRPHALRAVWNTAAVNTQEAAERPRGSCSQVSVLPPGCRVRAHPGRDVHWRPRLGSPGKPVVGLAQGQGPGVPEGVEGLSQLPTQLGHHGSAPGTAAPPLAALTVRTRAPAAPHLVPSSWRVDWLQPGAGETRHAWWAGASPQGRRWLSCPGEPPSGLPRCPSLPPPLTCRPAPCPDPPNARPVPVPLTRPCPRPSRRYVKHKRDDGPAKQEDEAVDVTPAMIGVFVVTCCSMLVLLYHFYDQLGLYSCLSPLVQRLPFCKCRVPDNSLPYFHKRPQVLTLLLALLCVAVSVVWGVFRNEDQWAWILQDALGIAFCLYTLKTIRLPTFKACTLLLLVLFIYDVFFVFITPFLTKSGNSIMVEVATGPSDSATHEKLPMVLKVPRLNTSPLALCDRPFSLLGFGDILVPGLLVAYCHRFDIQVQSSRVYFVACTIEGPTSARLGAGFSRRPAAPARLRHRPLPAASGRRAGPVPPARRAVPGTGCARGDGPCSAPPGAGELSWPRPGAHGPAGPLGLGEGRRLGPAPANLVLWSSGCAHPGGPWLLALLQPGTLSDPSPAPSSRGRARPGPAEATARRAGGGSRPVAAAAPMFGAYPAAASLWVLGQEREGPCLLKEGRLCPSGPPRGLDCPWLDGLDPPLGWGP